MLIIGTIIFLLVYVLAHRNLKSFHLVSKIVIVLSLFIIIILLQSFLIFYLLGNNPNLEEVGKAIIGLIIVVPIFIGTVEIISIPIITALIERYRTNKITKLKFIIYSLVLILVIYIMNIIIWV